VCAALSVCVSFIVSVSGSWCVDDADVGYVLTRPLPFSVIVSVAEEDDVANTRRVVAMEAAVFLSVMIHHPCTGDFGGRVL